MAASLLPLLVYGLLVAAVVLLPYLAPAMAAGKAADDRPLLILLAGGAALLTLLRGILPAEGAVLLVLASLGHGPRALLGSAAAALLLAATTWWLLWVDIAPVQHWLTGGACLIMALLARHCRFEPAARRPVRAWPGEAATVAALLAIGLGAGLLTGATNSPDSARMAWHHWGAYLSPVHALLAGGVPFRDFPVQYGMGPTLLLAAACRGDCWTGIYWVTLVANALHLATFGWMALLLTRAMDRASRALAIAALAVAMLVWTGYPPDWGSAVMTPSVGGLRFLPLALIAALVLGIEARADGRLPRSRALAGHALWLLGLAWSPETGFFATLVWWPWLALRRADGLAARIGKWRALAGGGLLAGLAVIAGYGALALLFRARFGDWAAPGDFLLYMRYPPGRLPVMALGALWFALAVLVLAGFALARSAAPAQRRALYAVMLAALAAFSYFLSRSHDNNVLNLLPWLILTLLAAQQALPVPVAAGFLRAALAGIVALTASINFHPWTLREGAASLAGLQIGPAPLTARFAPMPGDPGLLVHPDAAALYGALRREGAAGVLLFDQQMVMLAADPARAWSVVNNPANFVPLPDQEIRRYVRAGARLHARGGWLIAANAEAPRWLARFAEAYAVRESRAHGRYTAYRMVPR